MASALALCSLGTRASAQHALAAPRKPAIDTSIPCGATSPDPERTVQSNDGFFFPGTGDAGDMLVFPGTRVVANGGSLRHTASTGIELVGMPPGSVVVRAYLYWTWVSLGAPVPGLHDTLRISRVPRAPVVGVFGAGAGLAWNVRVRTVTGVLVGAGPDPCWFGGGNFVYRADVTPFITRGDTYLVWHPTGAAGSRDYSDPWGAPGPVPPLCEGATLVVVYTNGIEPMGVTYIYDAGLAGTMFLADPGLMYGLGGFFYPGTEARWINVGADGQTGIGYPDLDVMGLETTTFAGAPIAGPGSAYNDSDWNGSANKPLGQLWDTSGHDVSALLPFGAGGVGIAVSSPPAVISTDCLVAVCNVLWMN